MTQTGSGTGTPIPAPIGVGVGDSVIVPIPRTILSLDHYARIMGINPAHFWGASAPLTAVSTMPVETCGSLYHQYSWQDSDKVSRYDIAVAIAKAEQDIANALGYWPGPQWTHDEEARLQRVYRREYDGGGANIAGHPKSLDTRWKFVMDVGPRSVEFIAKAETGGFGLDYIDDDGDGFYETARIVVSTTHADKRNIKVFQPDSGGNPEYEIREIRKIDIAAGTATIYMDAWLLINPVLYNLPTYDDGGDRLIDISTTANYLTAVDVYYERVDPEKAQGTLYWENDSVGCGLCSGVGCEACGYVKQDACLYIRNSVNGELVARAAEWSSEDNAWNFAGFSGGREPDFIRLSYLSGMVSDYWKTGHTLNPIRPELARVIAHLATARLERDLCGCSNVIALSTRLRMDSTRTEGREGMFFTTTTVVNQMFGTRVGEIEAWRFCTRSQDRVPGVAVL